MNDTPMARRKARQTERSRSGFILLLKNVRVFAVSALSLSKFAHSVETIVTANEQSSAKVLNNMFFPDFASVNLPSNQCVTGTQGHGVSGINGDVPALVQLPPAARAPWIIPQSAARLHVRFCRRSGPRTAAR